MTPNRETSAFPCDSIVFAGADSVGRPSRLCLTIRGLMGGLLTVDIEVETTELKERQHAYLGPEPLYALRDHLAELCAGTEADMAFGFEEWSFMVQVTGNRGGVRVRAKLYSGDPERAEAAWSVGKPYPIATKTTFWMDIAVARVALSSIQAILAELDKHADDFETE